MASQYEPSRVAWSDVAGVGLTCLVTLVAGVMDLACADCPVPDQYPHSTSSSVGDLVFRVASDRPVYVVGQAVQMLFSVENIGSNPVVIPNPCGCSPLEAFGIFAQECPTPLPSACNPPPFWSPGAHFFFGTPITVGPGQCLTYTQTWDGAPEFGGAMMPGAYVIAGGMSRSMGSFYLPQSGVRLPIQLDQNVPTYRGTWGRLKVIYR